MTIGRNDPCPCGSGKKYKKCCLPQEAVISLEAVRTDRVYWDLREKLSNYMGSSATEDEIGRGFVRFFADPSAGEEEPDPEVGDTALDWVAFAHRTMEDGSTPCGRYATRGRDLTDQERALLHDWAASAPGFFRVQEAAGGELHLSRLPDGRSFSVRARGVGFKAGDLVAAWLLPVFSTYFFGYDIGEIPAEAVDPLTHLLEVEMQLLRRQRPAATWDELYRDFWPRLIDALALAVVHGANVLRIRPPEAPPLRWDGKQPPEVGGKGEDVARLVQQALALEGEMLLGDEIAGALRLWWDGALALRPRIIRPEGWAAGVVYLYRRDILDDAVTQAEVAEQLGVSSATVGNRSRELAAALSVVPLDLRYVDLLDVVFRIAWRSHCLMACGGPVPEPWELDPEPGALTSDEQDALDRTMRTLERSRRQPRAGGPEERAEELIDRAWEASGPFRTKLARQALQLWPDAADAYVILGIEAQGRGDQREARKHYEEGVRAGERALGDQFFTENEGHFYGLIESRPYMRARFGLVGCLWALGEREAAIAHCEELLRLNPGDNQGVRYLLAACLLQMGDDARLGRHLAKHNDDPAAAICYTRALWQFRQTGPGVKADSLLAEAVAGNPHLVAYLLGEKRLPPEPPSYMDMGGDLEATAYAFDYGTGWRESAGALDWLRRRAR